MNVGKSAIPKPGTAVPGDQHTLGAAPARTPGSHPPIGFSMSTKDRSVTSESGDAPRSAVFGEAVRRGDEHTPTNP
jgi:hypothetical protein